ncbi:hypothetical protein [Psychrobacter sp. I-STPA6b]|uniref:hypothetical protein n=1 Tax=Psychrobacter sp. I-STPA6b TaxID=2585718 RepID=UPI001D0CBAEB|nr:hypothetical protein [Psychrobacter sp. I-STPA6b]
MDLKTLLDDIKTLSQVNLQKNDPNNKIVPLLDIDKFRLVKVTFEGYKIFNDYDSLEKVLSGLDKVTGWIQATSEVKIYHNNPVNLDSPLLNAELVDEQGQCYLIDYLSDYQWGLQSCQIIDCEADDIEKATHLAERIRQQQVNKKEDIFLVYDKLWQFDKQHNEHNEELIAQMAFFRGFDEQVRTRKK